MHLAQRSGAEVILLHVCSPEKCHCGPEECHIQPMHGVYTKHTAEVVRDRPKQAGIEEVNVSPVILAGDPAHEILYYVAENDVSLIVIATHGRSGIKRWVMGSVAVRICQSFLSTAIIISFFYLIIVNYTIAPPTSKS